MTVLKKIDTEEFQHVGIIVDAQGDTWTTCDGGQGADGYQGGFVKRRFRSDGEIEGEFGNRARVKGWVDLDYLDAVARSAFPDHLR